MRSGINRAIPLGVNEVKGVFISCPIPGGTRMDSFVGELYDQQPKAGKFIIEVSRDVFIDAELDPNDVGDLFSLDPEVYRRQCSPPNYGHYVNNIYPKI